MDGSWETNTLIPLPNCPGRIDVTEVIDLGFRRFGGYENDLAIDFTSANRAALVTRLLESCVVDPNGILPDRFFTGLNIGKRIECILFLAVGGPDAVLRIPFKCVGCGEEIELELMLNEISGIQGEADRTETVGVDIDGRWMEFRKPTGNDQELWNGMVFRDEFDIAAAMINTLSNISGNFKPALSDNIHIVEELLDEADPLVDFSCGVMCGECGGLNDYRIDLTETALAMLNLAQKKLAATIHRLASHYHWSEQEIFSVPDWRRQLYLELIGAGK